MRLMKYESIILMGSADFAVPSFKKVYDVFGNSVKAVFTRPDAPRGRGKKLKSTIVKAWACDNDIAVYEPKDKDSLCLEIEKLVPDLIIVIAYGLIFPKDITDKYFCINVHGSILPKYRGSSPIHAALLNNDEVTGVSVIKMNEGMDTGDILALDELGVEPKDNFESLHNRMSEMSADILVNCISNIEAGRMTVEKQNEELASYCSKIKKEDFRLDVSQNLNVILGKIKAFSPNPGAYIEMGEKRVKIIEAEIIDNNLKIIKVKPEGKGTMFYKDYLLGNEPIVVGEKKC